MTQSGIFRELDVVRVCVLHNAEREFTGSEGVKRPPQPGDIGTVVHDYKASGDSEYSVECVNEQGLTVWLADFNAHELEHVDVGR